MSCLSWQSCPAMLSSSWLTCLSFLSWQSCHACRSLAVLSWRFSHVISVSSLLSFPGYLVMAALSSLACNVLSQLYVHMLWFSCKALLSWLSCHNDCVFVVMSCSVITFLSWLPDCDYPAAVVLSLQAYNCYHLFAFSFFCRSIVAISLCLDWPALGSLPWCSFVTVWL